MSTKWDVRQAHGASRAGGATWASPSEIPVAGKVVEEVPGGIALVV